MKRLKQSSDAPRSEPGPALLLRALEEGAGPALVLDDELRVTHATPGIRALLGTEAPVGARAPKLLCGDAVDRPIAQALAEGRSVTGVVHRPRPEGGHRLLRVRAIPLRSGAGDARDGWVLLLDEEREDPGAADAPVLFQGMWTRDPAMKRMFHVLERAAARDVSVLVRGETGTGKELVAQALHALSPRAKGPFRAINCAALPPTLLESELFGHTKGAFTGAVRDQPGIFRSASGGTLFLDEIAELSVELQAKLLRVLETRTVLPVGGREPVPVDVRIVAATHQSLRRLVDQARFRADLMYRLRVVPIFLPPLRARTGDVALLAQRFIETLNEAEGRRVARISQAALDRMQSYPWPGNVRELRNVLEYAYVVGDGPVLAEQELPPELTDPAVPDDAGLPINVPPPAPAGEAPARSPEEARIVRALERAGGSRERAAQLLGVSRVTLWRRMRALGVDPHGEGPAR